jgi:PiT family inorganic phosphate transporter
MNLKSFSKGTDKSTRLTLARLAIALLFIVLVYLWITVTKGGIQNNTFLIIGAVFGAYMAMNIGANDVANNVGPAVGSGALTMFWAIVIAATFEASGALIAGGDVVKTIKKGIIEPSLISDPQTFIWAMTASLLAAALWLNFATSVGAPVSTTHSIVGGVMGAGIAIAGFRIVNWVTIGKIVISWIISPILGGIIAASFLYFIKKKIIYQENKTESAKKYVPIMIATMTWAFATYIVLKGIKHIIKLEFPTALTIGLVVAVVIYILVKHTIAKVADKLENSRMSVNTLFTIPLIFSAALLSFAHGANDVANAVGPLAGINDAIIGGAISKQAHIPLWVMAVGGLGISIGLALYGPKLIRTVGSEITELDQIRAFSIAMAAAITVIIASQLGLPVSSTHIAVGGVFGVGFLREWMSQSESNWLKEVEENFKKDKNELSKLQKVVNKLLKKEDKSKDDYKEIVKLHSLIDELDARVKIEKKDFKKAKKQKYVKREAVKKIVAAWVITVPMAALLSASIYFMIRGIVLP